jgi:hypothetical protein
MAAQGRLLTTNPLRAVAVRFKRLDDQFAMVALHFNYPILDCPAATAGRAQLLAEQGQRNSIERQPLDEGHALSAPSLGLARHTHHAIACGRGLGPGLAGALRKRKPAFGTHAPDIGGIHKRAF